MKHTILGLPRQPWLAGVWNIKAPKVKNIAEFFVVGPKFEAKDLGEFGVTGWQVPKTLQTGVSVFMGAKGPIWLLKLKKPDNRSKNNYEPTFYAQSRDCCGLLDQEIEKNKIDRLKLQIHASVDQVDDTLAGLIVGLELSHYRFKEKKHELVCVESDYELSSDSIELAWAINFSRHLVNLPANLLHPKSYSKAIEKVFADYKDVKCSIMTEKTLKEKGYNLLVAVGQAAEFTSRLVHLKYRPKKAKNKTVVLVGKGITFDSGGLNIKTGPFMRHMKKDMGGSASALGSFYQAVASNQSINLDCVVALAENAVSATSFRPGDVIKAANGKMVEIDNTDAEGRLVLADALAHVQQAYAKKEIGELIIFATLTGAMRVSVGIELAGYFSSEDKIADQIFASAVKQGDPAWRLPLYKKYFEPFKSNVADFANSVPIRYGGAISAALFLSQFIEDGIQWSHFDFMSSIPAPSGALAVDGGNGQLVQLCSDYLLQK